MGGQVSITVRDHHAATANTALMYLFGVLLAANTALSVLPPTLAARLNRNYRGRGKWYDEPRAWRLVYANAGLAGASLLYVLTFLVLNRTRSTHHFPAYAQIFALLAIFGWTLGLSIVISTEYSVESWYQAVAIVDWVTGAVAFILAAFLSSYTLTIHGLGGIAKRFAPLSTEGLALKKRKEADHPVETRDRGARIALIVLVSLLDVFLLAAWIFGCVETMDLWEAYARGTNPAHIVGIVLLASFWLWLSVWLFLRTRPSSLAMTVRSDVVIFTTFAVLILATSGASLGVLEAEASYMGWLTMAFGFAAGCFTLVIVLFEAIYTAFHGDQGAWLRCFATSVPPTECRDLELADAVPSARSSSIGKENDREDDAQANMLGYA